MRFLSNPLRLTLLLTVCLAGPGAVGAPPPDLGADGSCTIDFRYAPPQWQTSICLPDDWQKTLVAKDGGLLYDYPGRHAGFRTKITFDLGEPTRWVKQELLAPRIPIVRTYKTAGPVQIVEETFAVVPLIPPASKAGRPALPIERIGANTGQRDWSNPQGACDPDFRHVGIGWNSPIEYRFPAKPAERFEVVFGLCEGYHSNALARVLDLQVEGKTRRTVDLVKEKGRNVPAVFGLAAQDENGDGYVNLAVTAAEGAPDRNTILNLLWVFRAGEAPDDETVLRGGPFERAPLVRVACGVDRVLSGHAPRHDVMIVTLRNPSGEPVQVTPRLRLESDGVVQTDLVEHTVSVGPDTELFIPAGCRRTNQQGGPVFAPLRLAPGGTRTLVFGVGRGDDPAPFPGSVDEAQSARTKAGKYWETCDLPYDRLVVPDAGVQALLDSSIRNIYQAREIKDGLPAFQVGPTCYRGLWVVDGSFLLEAMTYLGRANETRAGIQYLLNFQRGDGSFMLIDGHWKETGIVLWAVTRHAELTGDLAWLREVWAKVEKGFAYIEKMRQMPSADAPNAGLIPDGFSDGGLADRVPEYTNIYWTMAGMRAAIAGARRLGKTDEASAWQKEYDNFNATFRRAADRDMKTDARGNRYLPIRMAQGKGIPPQKAQWAFLHAVYPGQVFQPDDPLVRGNMAMLRSVEREGLVCDTGWLKNGIWNYFGSFYGHAWLWLGDGQKAVRTLYAFGNHASPLLCWREEHMPQGEGDQVVGDMPHNWASAEFIRLTRHCLALERGRELHLFEGFPAQWARPGAVTEMKEIATEFGPLSLRFNVTEDGTEGRLHLTPPRRRPPERIVWHLDGWSGQTGVLEMPAQGEVTRVLRLRP